MIENADEGDNTTFLESRRTQFRLLHINQNCHLYSTPERLPDWGFQQQEVSCIFDGLKPKTIWTIDETQNELLPENVTVVPEARPGFLSKLARVNRAMWTIYHEYIEEHPAHSRPHAWPVLFTAIPFWFSDDAAIVLIGNPYVYWTSTVAVLTFFMLFGFFQLREKRGFHDSFHGLRRYYENSAGFFVLGWLLHYVPFYVISRQSFLHDYMPALYFAVLTFGVGIDLIQRRFPRAVNMVMGAVVAVCIVYTYWVYRPITYGEQWTVAACEKAQLVGTWELNCNRYAPAGSAERLELFKQAQNEYQTVGLEVDEEAEDLPAVTESIDYGEDEDYEEGVYNEEEEDDEEYGDELPTEAPVIEEPEPEFVDGKEVFGPDDDEEEYPRTLYGYEPDDEEVPATIRKIPVTKAND